MIQGPAFGLYLTRGAGLGITVPPGDPAQVASWMVADEWYKNRYFL